jgi:hypothetical protein
VWQIPDDVPKVKRNNLMSETISKKLNDSMLDRIFKDQQQTIDHATMYSVSSKKSLQSITTKASRKGIFDEPSYFAKKLEQQKKVEK